MGDRFALVRVDSGQGRMAAGRQALRNVGAETRMRAELAEIVGRLLRHADIVGPELGDDTAEELLAVADLVTLARTAVEKDYKGTVLEAHAPEAPTRFTKMLGQIVRGGITLGLDLEHCKRLAFRVARDPSTLSGWNLCSPPPSIHIAERPKWRSGHRNHGKP